LLLTTDYPLPVLIPSHVLKASLRDTEALIEYCYECEPGATEGPEQSISRLVNPVISPSPLALPPRPNPSPNPNPNPNPDSNPNPNPRW